MGGPVTAAIGGAFDAIVNYVDPAQIGPDGLTFNFDQAWSGIPVDARTVRIEDAVALAEPPTLETNGFQTLRIACPDLATLPREEIEQYWVPAVKDALLQLTGADAVACWAFSMRFSERKPDAPRNDVSNPARRVHADFSPPEFGHGIRHRLTREAIERIADGRRLKRWFGLNAWQAWSPPPYDTPLAVCDIRTMMLGDLVIGTGSAPSNPGLKLDLSLFSYSPAHRWYYYPALAPDEVLIFHGIDSAELGHWRIVPHTAVDNPLCPPDAAPRCSVEMRTMALFFD
jgi:hypothetical protein